MGKRLTENQPKGLLAIQEDDCLPPASCSCSIPTRSEECAQRVWSTLSDPFASLLRLQVWTKENDGRFRRGLRPPHSIFTNSDFTNPDFAGLPDKLSVRPESISLSRCSLDAVARFAQAKDLRCRAIYRPAFQATETLRAAMRARADPSGTAARCSVSNAAPKPARPKTAFASTAAVAGPPTRRCKISIILV